MSRRALNALHLMRTGMIASSALDSHRVPGSPGTMRRLEAPAIGRHSEMPEMEALCEDRKCGINGHRAP
jgi:hypothetical protein